MRRRIGIIHVIIAGKVQISNKFTHAADFRLFEKAVIQTVGSAIYLIHKLIHLGNGMVPVARAFIPIGASANITGIGILRREGYEVKNADFFKIGIPFTLAAIIPAYIYIWLLYGV